ncbi:hypothetical protein [Ensifer canadensis]
MNEIPIIAITVDEVAQIRAGGTDQGVVAEYAEAMEQGAIFPPVIIFGDESGYFAADGFHRIAAATRLGRAVIAAEVRQGTLRDAILYAAGANSTHGLRRTTADKRRAVTTLLRDPTWTKWSDRKIGEACGCDHKTVAAVRREMTGGEFPHGNSSRKPKAVSGEIPHKAPSLLGQFFLMVSDEELLAECRRRSLEVEP